MSTRPSQPLEAGLDLVADVLARVRELCPAFTEEMECEIDLQARAMWGGSAHYVSKVGRWARRCPDRLRQEADRALRAGESVRSAALRLGVSRATLYRVLKRRQVRP